MASEEAINLCHSFESPYICRECDAIQAVHSLAVGLINVGRVEEGTSRCQEAVAMYRKFIGDSSDIVSVIESLLQLLSEVYRAKGQLEEAVAASEEAVSLCRDKLPKCSQDLVFALGDLSESHIAAGNLKDALQSSEEAVELSRKLPSSSHASSALAYSLQCFSSCLAKYGRKKDAFEAAQEALDLYQKNCPNDTRRRRHLDGDIRVAEVLHDLTALLAAAGRPVAALENTRESSNIYRIIITTRPFFLPKFVTVLKSLSFRLSEAGRKAESINVQKEEVMVRQYIVSAYPDLVPVLQYASN
jgi:tetratricopeptide (TPR) repeat protein